LSLIMFDIDHFKRVNDVFGHLAGDEVLVRVAHAAASAIRQSDVVARWGGEEFMVLVPETSITQASQMAEKLRELIAGIAFVEYGQVTCSFGVAELRPDETVTELTTRTDGAMYQAKKAGRNRVVADT
jgi:diguanylate cyclase (GGDEF)-like protein